MGEQPGSLTGPPLPGVTSRVVRVSRQFFEEDHSPFRIDDHIGIILTQRCGELQSLKLIFTTEDAEERHGESVKGLKPQGV